MIQHSPISMVKYYISKLCSTLLTFMLSIIVVFSIGHFVRGVNLPMVDWLLIALILLVEVWSLLPWVYWSVSCQVLSSCL